MPAVRLGEQSMRRGGSRSANGQSGIGRVGGIWDELSAGFTALAPMEGVTDVVFRQVVARAGRPDLFFTEFTNVSSFASERGRANALERLTTAPEHFAALAAELEGLGFAGLDINMGCPDRHVNAAGGGAAMIRTPELAAECVRKAQEATRLPVSVKTRLGYSFVEEWRNWLTQLLELDLAALTVHLRTRKEMSKVPAHYELIPEIVELVRTVAPVTKLVINGDIKDLRQVRALTQEFVGVDGWMIGRGVFENPYCFTEHQPTRAELLELLRLHLDLFDQEDARVRQWRLEQGVKPALAERGLSFEPLKHYFKIYVRDFEGAAELRARLMECHSTAEAREVLA